MSETQRLALVKRNQTNIKRASILAQQEVFTLMRTTAGLTDLQTVVLIRDTIPIITDRYGTVSATAALTQYDSVRTLAIEGKNVKSFTPVIAPANYKTQIDNIIGYGIGSYFAIGRQKATEALYNGITEIVANYNRDTITYNAEQDRTVGTVTIQRVAEPNACAFCSMLAVKNITFTAIQAEENLIQYEKDWHNGCNCSVEAVFEGQTPIEPPYYKEMKETYSKAYEGLWEQGKALQEEQGLTRKEFLKENKEYALTTKNITREMRKISNMK